MLVILAVLSCLAFCECSLLLWSPERLQLPALKVLQQEDFEGVLEDLKRPNVLAFNADLDRISTSIPRKLGNLRSSYVPGANFLLENSLDLVDDLNTNTELIEESLRPYKKDDDYQNVLVAIHFGSGRSKREDADATESVPVTTEAPAPEEPGGPVVYSSEGTIIIYSSQAPRLRINSTTLLLGPTENVGFDNRDGYTRLIATVKVRDGKVILRFKFPVANGYWSLTSVEVFDHRDGESGSYNLSVACGVGARRLFSYRCHKDTVFRDAGGTVELVLYGLQAQPDARNGSFSDAYNCVNFMTAPIWSGILVTASLIVGFFIALAALGDIKTMDKFDNYRTKQLSITVAE